MVDLAISVANVEIERYAVAPALLFNLHIVNQTPTTKIGNVLLHCQLRIDPTQRRYADGEHERLTELFGAKHRWGESLHTMLWAHVGVQVPSFGNETTIAMPVPCSFDFNVATTKYFHGLEDGDIPLTLLFSGTVFYRDADDRLQMEQIAWSHEADFRLPVSLWREMMEVHYPDSAWLRIDRATFDALAGFKRASGLTSWEAALQALLQAQALEVAP